MPYFRAIPSKGKMSAAQCRGACMPGAAAAPLACACSASGGLRVATVPSCRTVSSSLASIRSLDETVVLSRYRVTRSAERIGSSVGMIGFSACVIEAWAHAVVSICERVASLAERIVPCLAWTVPSLFSVTRGGERVASSGVTVACSAPWRHRDPRPSAGRLWPSIRGPTAWGRPLHPLLVPGRAARPPPLPEGQGPGIARNGIGFVRKP